MERLAVEKGHPIVQSFETLRADAAFAQNNSMEKKTMFRSQHTKTTEAVGSRMNLDLFHRLKALKEARETRQYLLE